MNKFYITIAALIFIAGSIFHLINFFIGGIISVFGFAISPYVSLVLSPLLGLLAFKLMSLK